MSVRIMPKNMQIVVFKRLFPIWNSWREEDYKQYDVGAEMDNVDWDIIEEGANFHENLHMLENNYPQYSWSNVKAKERDEERNERERLKAQIRTAKEQHEELFEAEQQQGMPIPDEAEVEPEVPPGKWKVEKIALGERHTIEIEVKPHITKAKGKTYTFGRIQLLVNKDWIGCPVKVSITVPKI